MTKVNAAERLMNLIIALANSQRGLTREDIQTRINGYTADVSKAAFERMFERDKTELRRLGIPLETLGVDGPADEIRYRIDMDNYSLADFTFNRAELTTIALAHKVINDEILQGELGAAVQKLLPVTVDSLEVADGVELAAHMRPVGQNFVTIAEAIRRRQDITFTYRAANTGEEALRHLQPYRLKIDAGARYVHGWDCDRGETRTFRLSRIVGDVTVTSADNAYEIPEAPVAESATDTTPVVVAIRADQAHHVRRLGEQTDDKSVAAGLSLPADVDIVQIETDNPAHLAEAIAACGEDVLVLEPSHVRQLVLQRLRAAVTLGAHDGE